MHIAAVRGEPVGYVSWLPKGFVGRDYLTFLAVREDRKRRGTALALIRSVELHIGCGRLFISTEEDNVAMLALLPREAWTNAGAVAGANDHNRAEVFFYKDLGAAA